MIDLQLSEPQAAAIVQAVDRGGPPSDGRHLAALRRARDRLAAALDRRRTIPQHAHDCDALSDALSAVGRADFVALMTTRLRDLTRVAELWSAVERRAAPEAQARLLDPARVDAPGWQAEAVDAIEAAD